MAEEYDPKAIEGKWQKEWADTGIFKTKDPSTTLRASDPQKPKTYVLDMFPYPSGEGLHVGHPKGYIATDIYSRHKRMQGHEVLHPMGWDAFGLPAENYALKNKIHPRLAVEKNIANFKSQLANIGFDYDWSREINTTDSKYYKWTQWIFLELFKRGLAYQSDEPINWCPSCMTGLANEDLDGNVCERCGTQVEKRRLPQWVLKITRYADRMLEDLNILDWPEHIKEAQRNWIGRSEGAEIDFNLKFSRRDGPKPNFVILHGYTGHANTNFIPWLKSELESQGFEVQAPELPKTDNPKESEQVGYVIENCNIDEKTILVGHSLGGVVAMKVLEKINRPIAGLVLIAPAVEPEFRTGELRPFWDTFNINYDYEKLKSLTNFRTILSDTQEEERAPYLKFLADKVSATLRETIATEEHFCAGKEPFILKSLNPSIAVFTTRPDTIFGATYMILAPEHELVEKLEQEIVNKDEVKQYIAQTKNKAEIDRTAEGREKTGVELKGIKAINPATKEEIPVWIADYVLPHYGTGAIMAVPADDERDKEFAEKFNLPIIENYTPAGFEDYGKKVTKYKLRDWVFSRQRYWGEPIPIIHCNKCGAVAVPEKDLPVLLPEVESYEPSGTGESPLAKIDEWVNVSCPECGGKAKRETNTMPQWAGSSWYYLRFMDPDNDLNLVDKDKEKYWSPVDVYVGGDHAVRHLIYARFWHKFLYDIGIASTVEPFARLEFLGFILAEDGKKMSKRLGNIINPDDVINTFGADAFRIYEMFMGPFENTVAWSTDSIVGTRRFVERVWRVAQKTQDENIPELETLLHQTIKKVTEDIEAFKFNTAISQMMIFVNAIEKKGTIGQEQWRVFLKLLAPFAPHITEELWHSLGHKDSIHTQNWPTHDSKQLLKDEITLAIQINGKVRASLLVSRGQSEEEIRTAALSLLEVKKWLNGKEPKRVIIVPGRIISIVT